MYREFSFDCFSFIYYIGLIPAIIIFFKKHSYFSFSSVSKIILSAIFFLPLAFLYTLNATGQSLNNCTPPTAVLDASSCKGGTISLKLKEASGHSPFSIVVNGVTFKNVKVGQTFAIVSGEESIWGVDDIPENADANDGDSIEVGVKFRSLIDGYIKGIRFYKGVQNTGIHIGSLWTSTGTRLATATFTNETVSGWQEVRFATPVAIAANTTYIASYLSSNGGYAFSGAYFTNGDITNKDLTALQSKSAEPNGVFKYGRGFPDNAFGGANYWVDVLFNSSPFSGQTTKFTLTSIVDSQNCSATGAALSQTSVTTNPLPNGTIRVSGETCENDTINLVFNSKSGTGPFNLVINKIPYTNIISDSIFNTGVEVTSAISLWANSTLPRDAAQSSDTGGVELGVKFKSAVNGKVLGIRFYKGLQNSGTHTGSLWTTEGTLLATGTFKNETSTGWQQLLFIDPVVIQANTVYVVSYYTPVGNYIFLPNFFTHKSISNSFLTALSSDEDGPNGVFKYGPGGIFPTDSFNNTNYWVDVVFKPDTAFTPESNIYHLTEISDSKNCTLAGDPIYDLALMPVSCIPSFMDSLEPISCSPQSLKIILSKPVKCSSIAADGSDFTLVGPYNVGVKKANSKCSNNEYTSLVIIELDKPLQKKGEFQLHVKTGSDGNTLKDEHNQETSKDSVLKFIVKDTINATFNYTIRYGCTTDTVFFTKDSSGGANRWLWNLDDNIISTNQSPMAIYSAFNAKKVTLVASNGFCSDTATADVVLNNFLAVDFDVRINRCSHDPVEFISASKGKVVKHQWDFGDAAFSNLASPFHTYQNLPGNPGIYHVNYSITDQFGCTKSITKPLDIFSNCTIYVPNAFTPNGDSKNDVFRPLNTEQAEQFEFKVFNRWGQQLFVTKNRGLGWDGIYRGEPQSAGTYVWMIRYSDKITRKIIEQKGTFILIR